MSASTSKKTVALQLLERSSVFIHLDPRREGVMVPQGFVNQAQLVLQIGFDMAVSIPDLDVDDEGISCTLSFNRQRHFCRMPWSAIFALIGQNGGGRVWRDDVPAEVLEQRAATEMAAASNPAKSKRPHLRAVGSADESVEQEAEGEKNTDAPPPGLRDLAEKRAEKAAQAKADVLSSTGVPADGGTAAALPELGSSLGSDLGSGAAERVDFSEASLSPKAGPQLVLEKAVSEKEDAESLDSTSVTAEPRRRSSRAAAKSPSRPPYLRLVE